LEQMGYFSSTTSKCLVLDPAWHVPLKGCHMPILDGAVLPPEVHLRLHLHSCLRALQSTGSRNQGTLSFWD
jgi:hypothetical protein